MASSFSYFHWDTILACFFRIYFITSTLNNALPYYATKDYYYGNKNIMKRKRERIDRILHKVKKNRLFVLHIFLQMHSSYLHTALGENTLYFRL